MKVNNFRKKKNVVQINDVPAGECFHIFDEKFHRLNKTSNDSVFFRVNYLDGFTDLNTGGYWEGTSAKDAIVVEAEVSILEN